MLKDYKRYVLWLDYFNSIASRQNGRRIPLDKSVKDPTLDELREASQRCGYATESYPARVPSRPYIPSGYISIEKKSGVRKSQTITDIAKALSTVRGEKTTSAKDQAKTGQKKR